MTILLGEGGVVLQHHDPRWIMTPTATDRLCVKFKRNEDDLPSSFPARPAFLLASFRFRQLFSRYLLESPSLYEANERNLWTRPPRCDLIPTNRHMCMCAVDRAALRCFGYFVPRAAK